MFDVIFRYDWLLFIVFGSVLIVWVRHQLRLEPAVAAQPLLIANIHWLVSGLGSFLYPDRDSFARFDLRLGVLPYALIASVVAIWIVLADWLFRRGGADLLAESSERLRGLNLPGSPGGIKLVTVVCICAGIMGLFGIVITETAMPR